MTMKMIQTMMTMKIMIFQRNRRIIKSPKYPLLEVVFSLVMVPLRLLLVVQEINRLRILKNILNSMRNSYSVNRSPCSSSKNPKQHSCVGRCLVGLNLGNLSPFMRLLHILRNTHKITSISQRKAGIPQRTSHNPAVAQGLVNLDKLIQVIQKVSRITLISRILRVYYWRSYKGEIHLKVS